jgi:hypothetical protein
MKRIKKLGSLARRYGHASLASAGAAAKRVGASAENFAEDNAPLVAAALGGAAGGLVGAVPGAIVGASAAVAIEEAARKK